jgi:hypothetical protein
MSPDITPPVAPKPASPLIAARRIYLTSTRPINTTLRKNHRHPRNDIRRELGLIRY